jgi:hypothetical protein
MKIKLEFEYRDLTDEQLESLLFELQGLSGGKIYSIIKLKVFDEKSELHLDGQANFELDLARGK